MGTAPEPTAAGEERGDGRDRRARRRQETIEEILDLATEIMRDEGVGGLTLAAVARRLGVQPPSLYKYFPSRMAVYDALFHRGQQQHLDVVRTAMATASPGMAALSAGLDASGRWSVANPVASQLLFSRPIPGYHPSAEAFAPGLAFVELIRSGLRDAVAAGEVGRDAGSDEGEALLSILFSGMISQQMANEPEAAWAQGRFTRLLPRLLDLFLCAYPPVAVSPDGT